MDQIGNTGLRRSTKGQSLRCGAAVSVVAPPPSELYRRDVGSSVDRLSFAFVIQERRNLRQGPTNPTNPTNPSYTGHRSIPLSPLSSAGPSVPDSQPASHDSRENDQAGIFLVFRLRTPAQVGHRGGPEPSLRSVHLASPFRSLPRPQ